MSLTGNLSSFKSNSLIKEIKNSYEIFRRQGSVKITGFAKTSILVNDVLEHNNGINFDLLAPFSPSVGFS